MDELHEECGVAAVSLKKPLSNYPEGKAAHYLVKMLLHQQHRGQLSAGISTFDAERLEMIDTYKKLGSVNEAFWFRVTPKYKGILEKYSGKKGIGHIRYATSGSNDVGAAQPFERYHGRKWKWFSLAFNGNLANFVDLKEDIEKNGYHLVRDLDTEVIMHSLSKELSGPNPKDLGELFSNATKKFDGAYSLVYMNAMDELAIMRDPVGFKPLAYLENDDMIAAASESIGLNALEGKRHDVKPGEMIIVSGNSVEKKKFAKAKQKAVCMFEYVYFANPASTFDGVNVYEARWNLGKQLAKEETLNIKNGDYVVVAVPDTSKPAADGYAHELGARSMEGLMRNRYIGRTFIESGERSQKVKDKYSVNRAILKGKKVILVEDSIVRGTTSRVLVDYVRKAGGAKEVHMRVSCPPIVSPCFYGIDMSTMDELIAPNHLGKENLVERGLEDVEEKVVEKIAKEIGVESLRYQSLKSLVKAIGLPKNELCMACINGEYPTPCGKVLAEQSKKNMGKKSGRTYQACGTSGTCGGKK